MNKQEKLIAFLLGLALVGWMFYSSKQASAQRAAAAKARQAAAAVAPALPADTKLESPSAATNQPAATPAEPAATAPATPAFPATPDVPEQKLELTNEVMSLTLSTWGGVIQSVQLQGYTQSPGKLSEENPLVVLGDSESPILSLSGITGLAPNAAYEVKRDGTNAVVFSTKTAAGLEVTRRLELLSDYQLGVKETFRNAGETVANLGDALVGVGELSRGKSNNDLISVDSLPSGEKKIKFWGNEKATGQYLVAGNASGFGCGGSSVPPQGQPAPIQGEQEWVAVKSRFFLTALEMMEGVHNSGFQIQVKRENTQVKRVSAAVSFPGQVLDKGQTVERTYRLFIGPKKLSLLQRFGHQLDDVMDFGMWSWLCKLMVPTLNGFYAVIPNYGIAIILLTFLVRLLFWPLTRKSTEGMRKMTEIQPLIKELQKKYKDNPQRLQQETFAIYREKKVNPLSSCLPMLIQIPVFIALFYVLRNSVELRYAPFLWIRDLSEPENLLAGVLPIPLNILPILMAVTMGLQSYFTPSAGDPKQQRMMMIMMPVMMLWMFYSFPSALSLYWTVSQVLSIVQMVHMQRQNKKKQGGGDVVEPEVVMTRQQRRHGEA